MHYLKNDCQELILEAPITQNGQTHSNNSSATAGELFEFVSPFCRVGAKGLKSSNLGKKVHVQV